MRFEKRRHLRLVGKLQNFCWFARARIAHDSVVNPCLKLNGFFKNVGVERVQGDGIIAQHARFNDFVAGGTVIVMHQKPDRFHRPSLSRPIIPQGAA